jgi:myo-inositol-1(or 4)-monophosphatase
VDKKQLLSSELGVTLGKYVEQIGQLVARYSVPEVVKKADGSPVTPLDLELSALFERIAQVEFPGLNFYSEEKIGSWVFPMLALDPLDGTREYIAGRAEWAISAGLITGDDFSGAGWIFNPLTNEVFSRPARRSYPEGSIFQGEISRSEWDAGLVPALAAANIQLRPMGSIAYKLGRLAAGEIDFVISMRPKNIWDIAAGTILCREAGIKFYSGGVPVQRVEQLFHPPLLWCREELFETLSELYCGKGKSR